MEKIARYLRSIGLEAKPRAKGVDVELKPGLSREDVGGVARGLKLSAVSHQISGPGGLQVVIGPRARGQLWQVKLRNPNSMEGGPLFRVEHRNPEKITQKERAAIAELFATLLRKH